MAQHETKYGHSSTGSCRCGNITYEAHNVQDVWYCHCRSCRHMTGHFMAACQVSLDDITINGEPKWYYVTERARYGFCSDCGSQIFWRNEENQYMSLTAGCMHNTAGLEDKGHIYVSEKGDYYQLPDDAKQSDFYD